MLEIEERAKARKAPRSPATHAILTLLKAEESVFQQFLWTETVFHALAGA